MEQIEVWREHGLMKACWRLWQLLLSVTASKTSAGNSKRWGREEQHHLVTISSRCINRISIWCISVQFRFIWKEMPNPVLSRKLQTGVWRRKVICPVWNNQLVPDQIWTQIWVFWLTASYFPSIGLPLLDWGHWFHSFDSFMGGSEYITGLISKWKYKGQ